MRATYKETASTVGGSSYGVCPNGRHGAAGQSGADFELIARPAGSVSRYTTCNSFIDNLSECPQKLGSIRKVCSAGARRRGVGNLVSAGDDRVERVSHKGVRDGSSRHGLIPSVEFREWISDI